MEFIDALRTTIGEFWTALKGIVDHTSDIAMLIVTTFAAIATSCAALAARTSTKVGSVALTE